MRRSFDLTHEYRPLLMALGLVLLGASISTIFSTQLTRSVPLLIVWLWLAAIVLLTIYLVQSGFSTIVVGMLLLALSAQVFWGYLIWVLGGTPGRLQFGTFYSPNQYAGFVLMLTPILVGLSLRAHGLMLAMMALLSAFSLSSIFLSGSRGGLAAAGLSMIAIGMLYRRRQQWVRLVMVVGIAGTIVWGSSMLVARSSGPLSDPSRRPAITQKFLDNPQSLMMRIRWAKGAVLIGASHPITGTGLGTFGDAFLKIQQPDWNWSAFAHNQYLEAFAEAGMPMSVGMVLIPVVALRLRSARWPRPGTEESGWQAGCWAGLFGASLHLLVDHNWSYPAFSAVYLIIAAMVVSSVETDQQNRLRDADGRDDHWLES